MSDTNAEILITSAINYWFIQHMALLVKCGNKRVVYHMTDYPRNDIGGNVFIVNESDFLKERTVYNRIPVTVDPAEVHQYALNNRHRKYNVVSYNCEHFVNEIVFRSKESPQFQKWLWSAGLTGFVGYGLYRFIRN